MRASVLLVLAALLAAGCIVPGGVLPPETSRPYYAELVGGAPFTRLVIQVDHAPATRPSEAALTHLASTLRNVTSKAEIVIDLQQTDRLQDPGRGWNMTTDLVPLARELQRVDHAPPTAILHVLYPEGEFEQAGVAGVARAGLTRGPIVVFLDTLRKIEMPLVGAVPVIPPAVEELERVTLLHEAGHAMGLVNYGLPMTHEREDAEHSGHTRNQGSVMYWQMETVQGIRQALLHDGSLPDTFDAHDRADLRAAGGR